VGEIPLFLFPKNLIEPHSLIFHIFCAKVSYWQSKFLKQKESGKWVFMSVSIAVGILTPNLIVVGPKLVGINILVCGQSKGVTDMDAVANVALEAVREASEVEGVEFVKELPDQTGYNDSRRIFEFKTPAGVCYATVLPNVKTIALEGRFRGYFPYDPETNQLVEPPSWE